MVIVLTTVTCLCYRRLQGCNLSSRACKASTGAWQATGRLRCIYIARRRGVIQLIAAQQAYITCQHASVWEVEERSEKSGR